MGYTASEATYHVDEHDNTATHSQDDFDFNSFQFYNTTPDYENQHA